MMLKIMTATGKDPKKVLSGSILGLSMARTSNRGRFNQVSLVSN